MTAGSLSWGRTAVALLLLGGLTAHFAAAQTEEAKKAPQPQPKEWTLPPVFSKPAPESLDDLRAIESHVQKVLDKVMPAVVGLRMGPASGSGVIINADGTVLTAGHVSGKPSQNAIIILPDGKQYKGKALGQNKGIDSGMVKITDEGKFPFLEMGDSATLKRGQWVVAIGHPGGFRANRTPVVRVGRILNVNGFVIQSDCVLVGGDSGGPLFDMHGRVIGIHSRINGPIDNNFHVPVNTFRQTYDRLAKGESWGGKIGQPEVVKSAGGALVFEKKEQLTRNDPRDKVKTRGGEEKDCYAKVYTFRMKAGSTYTLDLISGDRSGKKLDTYLRLEGPDGKELANDDDSAGFPDARIVHKALKDGDYRVVATSFDANQTGTFTLKIFDAEFKDALVSGRVEVLRAIKMPVPSVNKLVEEFNKVKVPLHLNALLIDDKGDPLPNREVGLFWDKGTLTLKSDAAGFVRWPLSQDKSKKLNLQLPAGARALLALTDKDGVSVGLKMKTDPAIETVKSAGGTVVKTIGGTLKTDDPVDAQREKCVRHLHEFPMQAGKTYTIDLVSEDFDAFLRLEDADGKKLAEDDDGGGFLNARVVHTPAGAGVVRIVVTTCDPGQSGAYRVTIREANAPAPEKK
jgi:S1-C subfamily serine protease